MNSNEPRKPLKVAVDFVVETPFVPPILQRGDGLPNQGEKHGPGMSQTVLVELSPADLFGPEHRRKPILPAITFCQGRGFDLK